MTDQPPASAATGAEATATSDVGDDIPAAPVDPGRPPTTVTAGPDDSAPAASGLGPSPEGDHDAAPEEGPEAHQEVAVAPRRFFSPRERLVLFDEAGGHCPACGDPLQPGFHVDHVLPYARGGPTDLANARALCPRCNQRKGAGPGDAGHPAAGRRTAAQGGPAAQGSPAAGSRPGERPPALPPWSRPLRPWQRRGLEVWRRRRRRSLPDTLVTAAPGTGKTDLALRIAHAELSATYGGARPRRPDADVGPEDAEARLEDAEARLEDAEADEEDEFAGAGTGLPDVGADLLLVVVPGLTLKQQWVQAAQRVGLRLTAGWGNGAVALPPDVHGATVTFAQLARLPEAVRLLCARRRVLAVLDEVHHAGHGRAWGDALGQALEHAQARLCLSGTAWREDEAPIPFVAYDDAGTSVADVAYGYGPALADGVVREVFFFLPDGQLRWRDERGERSAGFEEALTPKDRARRLRVALDPEGRWLSSVLARADASLSQARAGHPGARGLAVCMSAPHARAVASLLRALTGASPEVALSDDPSALAALARFRAGEGHAPSGREGHGQGGRGGPPRWLVVCRMGGEGFDVPDLRVLVYASHVTSEIFFRQCVGRTVRVVAGLAYQDALVYLPPDPRLVGLARGLLAERAHALGGDQGDRPAGRPGTGAGETFVPLGSEARDGRVLTGGAFVAASALEAARLRRASGDEPAHVPDHYLAAHLPPDEAATVEVEAATVEVEAATVEVEAAPVEVEAAGEEESSGGDGDAAGQAPTAPAPTAPAPTAPAPTYDEECRRARQDIVRLAGRIAREVGLREGDVHRSYSRRFGPGPAGLAGLHQKREYLAGKLRDLLGAGEGGGPDD